MIMNFKEWRDVIATKPMADNHLSGNIKYSSGQFETVFFKMRRYVVRRDLGKTGSLATVDGARNGCD